MRHLHNQHANIAKQVNDATIRRGCYVSRAASHLLLGAVLLFAHPRQLHPRHVEAVGDVGRAPTLELHLVASLLQLVLGAPQPLRLLRELATGRGGVRGGGGRKVGWRCYGADCVSVVVVQLCVSVFTVCFSRVNCVLRCVTCIYLRVTCIYLCVCYLYLPVCMLPVFTCMFGWMCAACIYLYVTCIDLCVTCMLPVCYLCVTCVLPVFTCVLGWLYVACIYVMLPVLTCVLGCYLYLPGCWGGCRLPAFTCVLPVCYLCVTCVLPVFTCVLGWLYVTCVLPVCYLCVTCIYLRVGVAVCLLVAVQFWLKATSVLLILRALKTSPQMTTLDPSPHSPHLSGSIPHTPG